jgi:hypothetical protein
MPLGVIVTHLMYDTYEKVAQAAKASRDMRRADMNRIRSVGESSRPTVVLG